MGMKVVDPWRKWFRKDNQTAGFTKKYNFNNSTYSSNLTFCSVRGAGHQVPQYQPKSAFDMFSRFLNGEEL